MDQISCGDHICNTASICRSGVNNFETTIDSISNLVLYVVSINIFVPELLTLLLLNIRNFIHTWYIKLT